MQDRGTPQAIRFLLNDRVVEVNDVSPTTSILGFLRRHACLTGTKEGCAEGDCGACTVVTGELRDDVHDEQLDMKAVNACIQFLPTLDGKAVFTVEYLRERDGSLHPVQEAMRTCHGSQCGFCTPGFVMSLWALYLKQGAESGEKSPDESAVRQAITGNLCRCTGYKPIIEAGTRMCDLPRVEFSREKLRSALLAIKRGESLQYQAAGVTFHAPRTLDELASLRAAFPAATMLAGGTDVGLWVNKQLRDLGDILYTGEVAELKAITESAQAWQIGAAVTLSETYALLRTAYPEMNEMWERFASTPIRNAGTLGGNVANGSPIGDSMPALIALGADVTLVSVSGVRRIALEDLYLAYQKQSMRPDEIVAFLHVPKPDNALRFRIYKLSKRFDSDISAVCGAFAIRLDGDTVVSARIAFGGMAATPKRAAQTEAMLTGRAWNEATAKNAMASLAQDYAPLTDMRASADYRLKSAGNLLFRFFLETRPVAPLATDEVSVFA